VLAKAIYELWGVGASYDELHKDCATRSHVLWPLYKHASFKFSLDAYCGKRTIAEQRDIIDSFRYLGFEGPIRMQDAETEFTVFEEWDLTSSPHHRPVSKPQQVSAARICAADDASRAPFRMFFGRNIASSSRHLIDKHDLKKRPYISTTSMDAELALVTATLALAGPGKMFFDPFVGTGGFLVSAAEFGALTFGSDIDGRSFRGKGKGIECGVGANFRKYGLEHCFVDCIISDLTNTPLRISACRRDEWGRWLDGIICDPPYGVREGLKVLGTRISKVEAGKTGVHMLDGVPAHTREGYIAPKRPYSFSLMLDDVLEFAARTLVDGGRLAFWMPTANEEEEISVPENPYLQLVHCCVQPFNKWSRRLLVYRRRKVVEVGNLRGVKGDRQIREPNGFAETADELNPFRKRYFQGFRASEVLS
jgi:tRNA (guanine10-N2)-methyltransferase